MANALFLILLQALLHLGKGVLAVLDRTSTMLSSSEVTLPQWLSECGRCTSIALRWRSCLYDGQRQSGSLG
jgi:hypothetical protein